VVGIEEELNPRPSQLGRDDDACLWERVLESGDVLAGEWPDLDGIEAGGCRSTHAVCVCSSPASVKSSSMLGES
jgi:hypothetical protein